MCLTFSITAALAAGARPAAAIEAAGSEDFAATGSLDFDDLTPGAVLHPGDPLAPGVTFGGVFPAEEEALVVDLGAGDLALEQRVRANGSSSVISFTFATPVTAASATVTVVAAGNGNPGVMAFDAGGAELGSWGFSPDEGVPSYMGFRNALPPEPGIGRLAYATSQGGVGAERFRVDDLVFAPEPAGKSTGAAAAAALALAARRRRRR
jgi:MYXO-CTERM domain-containing protein